MAISMTLDKSQIYPALPTMAEKAQEVCKKVDLITSVKILSGFDYDVKGTTYHFSTNSTDQDNITQGISSAMFAKSIGDTSFAIEWIGHTGEYGNTVLSFTADEFLQFALAFGSFKQKCLADGWSLKAQARACEDDLALRAFVEENDIERLAGRAKIAKEKLVKED